MTKIYNRIDEILKWELELTQKEFADRVGIHQSEISRIANGKNINLLTAQKIAKTLGKKIDDVWPMER